MGKKLLILLLIAPYFVFAKPYIKSESNSNSFFPQKVVAIVQGVKGKIAIVKGKSGYSIVVIEKTGSN